MGSWIVKGNPSVQNDVGELILQIDKQCIQKIFSPGFDEVMKKKLVSRLHKIVKSVDKDIKGRFDVHEDIFKHAGIPDEVPDLIGNKTGIRLDKNDVQEFNDLDEEFLGYKVIIGFLRKNNAVYGLYKISGIINKNGIKLVVIHFLFDDFVDKTGFKVRLERRYVEQSMDDFIQELESIENKEETFEEALYVLFGV